MTKKIKQKGYVLMSSLGLSVLMLLVGSSAVYMVQMGGQTVQAERKYQVAKYAADYGLNKAIKAVVDSTFGNPCGVNADAKSYTSSESTLPNSKGKYSYRTQSDEQNVNCIIIATGTDGNSDGARVVKTAIIPVKSSGGSGLGGMTTGTLNNLNLNGNNASIGSQCGPGVVYQNASQTIVDTLNAGSNVIGSPKVLQATINTYDAVFGPGITSWATLSSSIDSMVSTRASLVSNDCKVIPDPNQVNNTNCNSSTQGNGANAKTIITCSGGVNKTIDTTACSEVVISAGSMNITHDTRATTITANITNNLNITASTKGMLTSDNVLNMSPPTGNSQVTSGIFIGATAANLNMSGNATLNGLYFLGNPNNDTNLAMNINGTDKLAGAMVVNGTVNTFTRNGGGNASPNIEFDPSKIEPWRSYYGNTFLDPMNCDSGTPPAKKAMIEKTEMSLF
jgi:hypothetical protein